MSDADHDRESTIDHREFVASLPAATRTRLQQRSNAQGVLHLCSHLGAILLSGTLIYLRVPFWPAILPVHGVLLVFLFTLEHECTHMTPFRSRAINEWAGQLAGLVILLPFRWFRYFHLAHHKYTNVPGKDPELLAGDRPETVFQFLKYASGTPALIGNAGTLVRNAFLPVTDSFVPDSAIPGIRREARMMLLTYAAVAGIALTLPTDVLWLWLVPLCIGQPFLRLYLLAEHGRCPFVTNMFENTRTTLTLWPVRWLSWNMPFHTEHHAVPNVPFYRLPELHALAEPHLRVVEKGYVRFTGRYARSLSPRMRRTD